MDDDDVARIEQVEAIAWRSLCAACPTALASRLGLAVFELDGGLLSLCPAIDQAQFNRLLGVDGANIFVVDAIATAAARFREAGLRRGVVQLPPITRVRRLEAAARRAGLTPQRRPWAKFRFCDGEPATRADAPAVLEVDGRRGGEFGAVAADAFGMPGWMGEWLACLPGRPHWHCYLALDEDGHAIGAGALHCAEDAAWLGLGAVLARARRRGAQGALLARRVRDARAMGARLLTTETGVPLGDEPAPSYANILRCGFRVAYQRANWGLPG